MKKYSRLKKISSLTALQFKTMLINKCSFVSLSLSGMLVRLLTKAVIGRDHSTFVRWEGNEAGKTIHCSILKLPDNYRVMLLFHTLYFMLLMPEVKFSIVRKVALFTFVVCLFITFVLFKIIVGYLNS